MRCEASGCAEPVRCRDLCEKHYGDALRSEALARGILCSGPGCDYVAVVGALCGTHAKQKSKGKGLTPIRRRDANRVAKRDRLGRKHCFKCDRWREVELFGKSGDTRDGLTRKCNICARWDTRRRIWGLDKNSWTELWNLQGGLCPICSRELDDSGARSVCVDHDHACCPGKRSCGKCVRGILHPSCNAVLGLAYESPESLRQAARYLEEWGERVGMESGLRRGGHPRDRGTT